MSKVNYIPFNEAYINVPVGKYRIQEKNYLQNGNYKIVDQGKSLIAGYSNEKEFLKTDFPYILFGDHTKVIKYIDFPFIAGADGVRLFKASEDFVPKFLYYYLRSITLPSDSYGRHSKYLDVFSVPKLDISIQQETVELLDFQLSEIEKARNAIIEQRKEISNLSTVIIYESLSKDENHIYSLGSVLDEVKVGIGEKWQQYPVYGATRAGIALAKEPPGKHAQKYKPVIPGTVFYNPMRILIGSIAFAEDDDEAGITSPDYVVLKGKEGLVDSRWFYFWLKSPLGLQCINSLARGAVRERMLFNRLAEGQIELPDYILQKEASEVLLKLKQVSVNLNNQLKEIESLPNKIISNVFKDV